MFESKSLKLQVFWGESQMPHFDYDSDWDLMRSLRSHVGHVCRMSKANDSLCLIHYILKWSGELELDLNYIEDEQISPVLWCFDVLSDGTLVYIHLWMKGCCFPFLQFLSSALWLFQSIQWAFPETFPKALLLSQVQLQGVETSCYCWNKVFFLRHWSKLMTRWCV